MTRDKAIDRACVAMPAATWVEADKLVRGLEALGLIKFDEKPDTGAEDVLRNLVIRPSRYAPTDTGWMIGDYGAERIIATLKLAGYRVEKC